MAGRLEKLFPHIAERPEYAERKAKVKQLVKEMQQFMINAIEEEVGYEGFDRTFLPVLETIMKK